MNEHLDPKTVARALGGEVHGGANVVAPGPGHSPRDRSLSITIDADAPGGFVVNSFAGDDAIRCRDYVRERLNLPQWEPGRRRDNPARPKQPPPQVKPAQFVASPDQPADIPQASEVKRNGKPPRFVPGDLPKQTGEIRRHVYRRDGEAVCIKIKAAESWITWYRVRKGEAIGWQNSKPASYTPTPYIADVDPFDPAVRDDAVLWPEGEKDVDALARLGLPAITFGGAQDVRPEYAALLAGRHVVVVGDNDEAGRRCVERKVEELRKVAASLKVVDLSDIVGPGEDIADWIAAGATLEQVQARIDQAAPIEVETPARFETFTAADFEGRAVKGRPWLVQDMIPMNTVTLLGGDGGTGKSLLALQLAASVALGRQWIGLDVERPGPALFITAEDDQDEIHRRLDNIADAEGVGFSDMAKLVLASLAGRDALLATLATGGTLTATELFKQVKAKVAELKPSVVILDTLADLFPGNENDRAQARQFVGLLRGLAIDCNTAVVLLAHPSLSGLNSGSGMSGSTAWNNSVRSRLYLERVRDRDEDYEADTDIRTLKTMKANYSATGGEMRLRWFGGVFINESPTSAGEMLTASMKAEGAFLRLLRKFTDQGRYVNPSSGSNYAPRVFAEHPESEGISKRAFSQAMERLLADGKISIAEHGPASKRTRYLREGS